MTAPAYHATFDELTAEGARIRARLNALDSAFMLSHEERREAGHLRIELRTVVARAARAWAAQHG